MQTNLKPARVVSPGRIIEHELEARGWTQKDLATIMGRPSQVINEIVREHKRVTPQTAIQLAAALETSAEFWLRLEMAYRLSLIPDNSVKLIEIRQRVKELEAGYANT